MEFIHMPVGRTEFKDTGKGLLSGSSFVEVVLLEQSAAKPSLYQLKRQNLTPIESIQKLKEELRSQNDAFHLLGEVKEVKSDKKVITLSNGNVIVYKFLILVTGYHTSSDLGPAMTVLKDALIFDCLKVQEKLPTATPSLKPSLSFTLCSSHPDLQKMVDKLSNQPQDTNYSIATKRSLHVQIS